MQSASKSTIRKAGSNGFTNRLTEAYDPFAAADREKKQQKYSAMEDRGYDDLSNLETYKAQSYNNRLEEGGRYDYQDAAKAGLQSKNFDFAGDLSDYDSKAAGSEIFDMQDVQYLKKSGASNKAIRAHVRGLDNVHDSIKNSSQYGTTHYRGDMDKTKGIEQFDMGKGFNKWDVQYLKDQGYDDKAIADYGLASGKRHGLGTAKFLQDQKRLDTRAENTFGNRSSMQNQHVPGQVIHQPVVDTRDGPDFISNATDQYKAKNEADWARSQKLFNAKDRASQALAATQDTVKAEDMFKGLRQSVVDQADYYDASSTMRQASLFGDMWGVTGSPTWKSPSDPEEYKPDFMNRNYDFGKRS